MKRPTLSAYVMTGMMLALTAGVAHAENDTRGVVRDMRGNPVVNSFGNCVRTDWEAGNDECGAARPQISSSSSTNVAEEDARTVYFNFNRATLTPAGKQRLDTLAKAIKSDNAVKEARIVGFADRIGSESYNEKLSARRAQAVQDYLVAQGIVNSRVVDTRWVGENAPSANCPARIARSDLIDCLQKDRKVEVELDYHPSQHASR
jgi:OOP family OmpA-OmpF porin